jgi:tetratricopeptide (TPR) repeat protein
MATKSASITEDSRITPLQEKFIVWLVLLVTAVTYLGTIRFDFVYDDDSQILGNPFLRAWHFVPGYFISSVWKQMSPQEFGNYYRPFFILFLRANYAIFAGRPFGWHLFAIAMHLLVTWLTYVMVRKMTGQFTTAWLAALIFGVHPVHHEVVAWVSGMTESFFASLFLLAFLAYLQSRAGMKAIWMALSCALYALALLSKEAAIILPALVFAHGWIAYVPAEIENRGAQRGRFRSAVTPTAWYLPIAILYLLARNRVLSGLGHSSVPISPVAWLLTLPSILLFYVKNWFLPFRLSEFYDLSYQQKLSAAHVFLPLAVLLALGLAIWMLRNRLGTKAVGYAAAWIVIPLLPVLDTFVFKPDELVHDRYFYVPSIGAALLVALLIERVVRSRLGIFGQPRHVVGAGLAFTVVLASLAGQAASFWRNDYALFSRAHQIAPLNTTATNDLAIEMIGRHQIDAAQNLLETGYRNNPGDYHFPLNLGRMYYDKREFQKAESLLQQVRNLNPTLPDVYVLMAQIQLRQGRRKEAQENLRQAVQLNPYSAPAHSIYGIVLASNGDCTDADAQFEAALALDPGDALTHVQMNRCQAILSPTAPKVPTSTKPGQL